MVQSVRLGQKVQQLVSLGKKLSLGSKYFEENSYQVLDWNPGSNDFIVGASCLNNDSTPLQLCLTSSQKETSLRVIGDPGAFYYDPELRYNASVETLFKSILDAGASALTIVAKQTVKALIPEDSFSRSLYKQGFVWIAVDSNKHGIAFYIETAPLGQEQGWKVVEAWLRNILPSMDSANHILKKLKPHCIVASAGLEGQTTDDCRAKIYFRMLKDMDVQDLGIDILSSEEMTTFIKIVKGHFDVELDGWVMSIGFRLTTGELMDAKIDLCGHCLRYDSKEWPTKIKQITDYFSLTPLDTDIVFSKGEFKTAFIGFGLTTSFKPRLNLYINHHAQKGNPESDEIWGALKDAMHYLIFIQNENGFWNDFHLPVGSSDQWVTAYTAHALAQYGNKTGNQSAMKAALKAANWLTTNRTYSAGWGFNDTTGPDSDSTAMTIALLDELKISVAESDRVFLRDHWRGDDGVATYDEPNAWATGHWDVTPWSYHALSPNDRKLFQDLFVEALGKNKMSNGLWRSYWWRNPFYSTFITLEMLDKLGISEPIVENSDTTASIEINNAFDLACFIGIECIRNPSDERIGQHLRVLLNWQQANGQWRGAANLRVTDNTCYTPWLNPSGLYYEDQKSTITNATILRVLSRIIPSQNPTSETITYNWV